MPMTAMRLMRVQRLLALMVLISGCGGDYGGTTPAPTITIGVSPSGTALSAATVETFTATVSGGATVTWDFGDGTTGVGTSVTHTFRSDDAAPRTFTVVAAASSGGQTASASAAIAVRSLTGTWDQSNLTGRAVDVFTLTQSGATLTGMDVFNSDPTTFPTGSPHDVRNGVVAAVRSATWDRFDNNAGNIQDRVSLSANDSITHLSGTFTHRDNSTEPIELNRR
jgi:hypothetical protein